MKKWDNCWSGWDTSGTGRDFMGNVILEELPDGSYVDLVLHAYDTSVDNNMQGSVAFEAGYEFELMACIQNSDTGRIYREVELEQSLVCNQEEAERLLLEVGRLVFENYAA